MAAIASPYGLRPVKRADGTPYAGATTTYLIDPAGVGTNIYNGSIVYMLATGYVTIVSATGADATTNVFPTGSSSVTGALGVAVGFEYTNSEGQTMNGQYYPSGSLNGKIKVVDDPNVLFQAQLDGSSSIADLGSNTFLAAAQTTSTGSTRTGNSTSALDATVVQTTAAFRILQFVSPTTDAYPDVLVKFNPGYHSMSLNVGL